MIKKYEADGFFNPKIKVVYVERETEKSVWIDGRRRDKLSTYSSYFDTFEDAKSHLMGVAENKLNSARRILQLAQSHYGNVKGVREPK